MTMAWTSSSVNRFLLESLSLISVVFILIRAFDMEKLGKGEPYESAVIPANGV